MSHVSTIDLHVTDLDALKEAATLCGLEFRQGQTSYHWFGRHMGDYPLPKGFQASDLGKCEHALSIANRPGAYEVGIVKRRDGKPGYTMLWDFWAGGHGLIERIGADAVKLRDAYAASVAKKEMMRKGYRVQVVTTEKGYKVRAMKH